MKSIDQQESLTIIRMMCFPSQTSERPGVCQRRQSRTNTTICKSTRYGAHMQTYAKTATLIKGVPYRIGGTGTRFYIAWSRPAEGPAAGLVAGVPTLPASACWGSPPPNLRNVGGCLRQRRRCCSQHCCQIPGTTTIYHLEHQAPYDITIHITCSYITLYWLP